MNKKRVVIAAVLVMMLVGCDQPSVPRSFFVGAWVVLEETPVQQTTGSWRQRSVNYYEFGEDGKVTYSRWNLPKGEAFSWNKSRAELGRRNKFGSGTWSLEGDVLTLVLGNQHKFTFTRTQYRVISHKSKGTKVFNTLLTDQTKSSESGLVWTNRVIPETSSKKK